MDDVNTVYISNLKLDITDREIAAFLTFLRYENFVVQLGVIAGCRSTKCCTHCFVEFEDRIDANDLRNTLMEVSVHI